MDSATLALLSGVVFGASLLQSATGIGYGVIAGPVLLAVLSGTEAFQISALHSLLIALLLCPMMIRSVNLRLLRILIIGSALGIPFGFAILQFVDVVALKLVCALAVAAVGVALLRQMATQKSNIRASTHTSPSRREAGSVGFLTGIMGGMLAMPGPLAATWMSIRRISKNEIRATILTFFLFAYGVLLSLNYRFSGFDQATLKLFLILSPAVVIGVFVGHSTSRHVSERRFQTILLFVLVATVVSLLISVFY